MADNNDFLENLEMQVSEILMLRSMFPKDEEFEVDETSLLDAQDFLSGCSKVKPQQLNFILKIELVSQSLIEFYCNLPSSYPKVKPECFARSQMLTRGAQKELNDELETYLISLESGELCVLPAIQWIQENASKYYTSVEYGNAADESKTRGQVEIKGKFCRMWLYMHHIYSKTKRKLILEWSGDYNLTGFSLPGKPGVVCLEGAEEDVNDYFGRLRRLNWKKITCRHREEGDEALSINEQRMFKTFEEIFFDVQGTRENHMDMGQFFQFLEKNGFGYIFQVLFGIEGK
mgnify:CR=1 FL=1